MPKINSNLILVFKVCITACLIYFLTQATNTEEIIFVINNASIHFIVLAAIGSSLAVLVSAFRWRLIIEKQGKKVSLSKIVKHTFVGNFFNQVLPSTVGGDAIRITSLLPDGIKLRDATQSVIAERLTGLLVLLVWTAVVILFLVDDFRLNWQHVFLGEVILIVLITLVAHFAHKLKKIPILGDSRLFNFIRDFLVLLLTITKNSRLFFFLVGLSLAGQIFGASTIFALSKAFGDQLTLAEAVLVMPPIYLLLSLPFSIGGWGARETLLVFGLGVFGTSPTNAILIGITYGIIKIMIGVPSMVFWVIKRR